VSEGTGSNAAARGRGARLKALLRLSGLRAYLRGSLWLMPTVFVMVALVGGTFIALLEPAEGTALEPFVFGGTADGARDLLTALAGAMITVTGLTFSLTVVALQMAAGQYSPRVLRNFLTDRGNQAVLSTLVATFAYCIAVLRVIREEEASGDELMPRLAVTLGVVLSLVALGMLVYFLHHLTRQLRVDTILRDIATDTLEAAGQAFPEPLDDGLPAPPLPEPTPNAVRVRALRSGHLQQVELRGLTSSAAERDVVVRLRPAVGHHVTKGTTLAWVWPRDGAAFDGDEDEKGLNRLVHDRVQLGQERTLQQDVAFGLRQLVDIGAKALSTGMNDPTTAVQAVGLLSVVLSDLAGRQLGSTIDLDEEGRPRTVLPRPTFRDFLHLMCDQIRRYGGDEPTVVLALLGALADIAEQVEGTERAAVVEEEVLRTVEIARRALDDTEMVRIDALADLVQATLTEGRRPQPEVPAD
jgi:uncharacterized membrane protein